MEGRKDWQVQPEHSGNLIRLQNLIQRAAGFRLLILQQNRPRYRDGLIAFLRESQADSRVLNLKELGGFEAFESELEQGGQGRILHLINLESLGKKEQQAFFKGLNYHREYIARTCSGILAFWLPEPLVREMALLAADFWAWREQVLDFTLPVEPVERGGFDWVKNRNMEAQGKQERIKEIEEFLARPEKQLSLTSADLKRELGNLYKLIGEYDKAEQMLKKAIADYQELDEAKACAYAREELAQLMANQGEYEQALKIFKEQVLPAYERLGDIRQKAVTMGRIADILNARGELDKALDIRRNEQLPVFDRIGDIRAKAVTERKIADILSSRGQLDEALKILQENCIPPMKKIGAVRDVAVFQGVVADILQARGELDNALNIRRNEQLPVFDRIGDVREKAVTMGTIADILQARGELDKALDIRRNEQLPVFDRIGDVREKAVTERKIADILSSRGQLDEALKILQENCIPPMKKIGAVRDVAVFQGVIADILRARGELDKALEIRQQEELPVYERLGDMRELLLCRTKIALILHEIDAETNKERIEELLHLALADARHLKLPRETKWIENIMKDMQIKPQ